MQGLPSPLPQGQPPPPPPWQHPPQLRARTEFQLLRALRRYHERAHHHHHRCRERARRRHRPRAPLGPRRSGRGPVVDHVLLCRTLLRRAWQRRTRVEGGGGPGGAAAGGLARPVGVHSAGVCSNPGCGHQVAKSGCKTCGVRLCGGASKQGFGCINAHLQGVKPSFTPRTRPLSGGVQVMILSSLGPVVS
jgi:hypothetical protein